MTAIALSDQSAHRRGKHVEGHSKCWAEYQTVAVHTNTHIETEVAEPRVRTIDRQAGCMAVVAHHKNNVYHALSLPVVLLENTNASMR